MATRTNNAPESLKQLIVRISPVSHSPIIFDALSKENGQLHCVVNNEDKVVGLDFYMASIPMEEEAARKVVQAYAEQAGIPLESVVVRSRLPKTNNAAPKMRRKTDDANLVLVKSDKQPQGKQESNQDYRSLNEVNGKEDEFTKNVQAMHDNHGKSTAANPEGAVVKAADKEPRKKRKYTKTDPKAVSKRSQAALKQFHAELQKSAATQEPVETPAPTVAAPADGSVSPEVLKLALALQKLLAGE